MVEQQQEFYNKKIETFFEKIEHIHSNLERKIASIDKEMALKREVEESNKRLMYKMEERVERVDNLNVELNGVNNKVNAFEELMSVQRSELFRAMSEFETNVLKKHETYNRAFKAISSELNLPNPMLGTSF